MADGTQYIAVMGTNDTARMFRSVPGRLRRWDVHDLAGNHIGLAWTQRGAYRKAERYLKRQARLDAER